VPPTSASKPTVNYYDANYGNFHSELYGEIRRTAFGEDIGQSGWQTAAEQEEYLPALSLVAEKKLLDVCCGSGGPALRLAHKTGCALMGIDLHEAAISAARTLAEARGMGGRCEFQTANAAERLPFNDEEFDAITCIDAIIHLPDRPRVLSEWKRVLKSGGRMLFTDSTVVTGPLTKEEIAVRSSIGYFQFVPPDYDRRVLEQCGLNVLIFEDVTQNMAELAAGLHNAREAHGSLLRQIEGENSYQGQQTFLEVTSRIARERRLSRFLYVAEKA
jgi:2-polyprenyl-3-methyl-5-hydroxy-6-metoxy-1,4-benzoquinol methylase